MPDESPASSAAALRRLRQIVTLGALVLAVGHLIFPALAIDAITLGLLVIAVIPWLAPLVKSLELPGGWKVEFQEMQKLAARAETAGLLASAVAPQADEFSFQTISERDPNLALAGLRIEIEKRLVTLAERNGVKALPGGVGQLLRALDRAEVLTHEQRSVLFDMVGLLNSAVHGAKVDTSAADWAIEVGPRVLKSLDERIVEAGG